MDRLPIGETPDERRDRVERRERELEEKARERVLRTKELAAQKRLKEETRAAQGERARQRRQREHTYGEALRELIKDAGGVAAANRKWDIPKAALSAWLKRSRPSSKHLNTLAEIEGISLDWLFGFSSPKKRLIVRSGGATLSAELRSYLRMQLLLQGHPEGAVQRVLPFGDQLLRLIAGFCTQHIGHDRRTKRKRIEKRVRLLLEMRLWDPETPDNEELAVLRFLQKGIRIREPGSFLRELAEARIPSSAIDAVRIVLAPLYAEKFVLAIGEEDIDVVDEFGVHEKFEPECD